jgi:hypothetical protein
VKYPDIDERFFQESVMKYSKFFDKNLYDISNIKVELENSVKLKGNSDYKEISNLELGFRFYNYETENYEIIHSEKVEKVIVSGVNEIVTVTLENVNPKLISENYFRRGEFIISELTNYEIPKLKSDYKTLMSSIKSKSVPVVFSTPLETEVKYIATDNGISFNMVVETIFGSEYIIENQKLIGINQFKNNLSDYTYLSELRDQDKKGSWFVFTNKLNKHYLEHEFTNKDVISLSYILGKDLASQAEEKVYSFKEQVESTDQFQTYMLGNINPNSEASFFLKPLKQTGETLKHEESHMTGGQCRGRGNCVSYPFRCDFSVNTFKSLNKNFSFRKDLKGEIERIHLLVNGDSYKLSDLIKEKKVRLSWEKTGIAINIKDLNAIKKISNTEENVLGLKFSGYRKNHFNGVKLTGMSGKGKYYCPRNIINLAGHNKIPLSVDSLKFSEWAASVNWNKVIKGTTRTHVKKFSVGITSLISNFHN